MNNQLGAHELLEMHEVLQTAGNGINTLKVYQQFVRDNELGQLMIHQLTHMVNEYNKLASNLGSLTESIRSYGIDSKEIPKYGLDNPKPHKPIEAVPEITDRDITSAMLGVHKNGAKIKLNAALECADPELKVMLVQSSNNCVYQAYDVWSYMNKKGYYQVPTLSDDISHQMINMYEPLTPNLGPRFLI